MSPREGVRREGASDPEIGAVAGDALQRLIQTRKFSERLSPGGDSERTIDELRLPVEHEIRRAAGRVDARR